MEAVTNWVKNLIFIILFTTLLELFLPASNMRKYLRIVLGFFIITIFISPMAAIFNQDLSDMYYVIPEGMISGSWDEIEERGERLGQTNRKLMKEYYADRLKKRIKEVVDLEYPSSRSEIDVEINDEYQLKGVWVTLDKTGKIKPVEVEPIHIGDEEKTDKNNKETTLPTGELKDQIARLFQVPLNKIHIIWRKGE